MKTKKYDMRGGTIGRMVKQITPSKKTMTAPWRGVKSFAKYTKKVFTKPSTTATGFIWSTKGDKARKAIQSYGITNLSKFEANIVKSTTQTSKANAEIARLKDQQTELEKQGPIVKKTLFRRKAYINTSTATKIRTQIAEQEKLKAGISKKENAQRAQISTALQQRKGLSNNLKEYTQNQAKVTYNATGKAIFQPKKTLQETLNAIKQDYNTTAIAKRKSISQEIATQEQTLKDAQAAIKMAQTTFIKAKEDNVEIPKQLAALNEELISAKNKLKSKEFKRTASDEDKVKLEQRVLDLPALITDKKTKETNLKTTLKSAQKAYAEVLKDKAPILSKARKAYYTQMGLLAAESDKDKKPQNFNELKQVSQTGLREAYARKTGKFMGPLKSLRKSSILTAALTPSANKYKQRSRQKYIYNEYLGNKNFYDKKFIYRKKKGEDLVEKLKKKGIPGIDLNTITFEQLKELSNKVTNSEIDTLKRYIRTRDTKKVIAAFASDPSKSLISSEGIKTRQLTFEEIASKVQKIIPGYISGEPLKSKDLDLSNPVNFTAFKDTIVPDIITSMAPKIATYFGSLTSSEQVKLLKTIGIKTFTNQEDILLMIDKFKKLDKSLQASLSNEYKMLRDPDLKVHLKVVEADSRKKATEALDTKVKDEIAALQTKKDTADADLALYKSLLTAGANGGAVKSAAEAEEKIANQKMTDAQKIITNEPLLKDDFNTKTEELKVLNESVATNTAKLVAETAAVALAQAAFDDAAAAPQNDKDVLQAKLNEATRIKAGTDAAIAKETADIAAKTAEVADARLASEAAAAGLAQAKTDLDDATTDKLAIDQKLAKINGFINNPDTNNKTIILATNTVAQESNKLNSAKKIGVDVDVKNKEAIYNLASADAASKKAIQDLAIADANSKENKVKKLVLDHTLLIGKLGPVANYTPAVQAQVDALLQSIAVAKNDRDAAKLALTTATADSTAANTALTAKKLLYDDASKAKEANKAAVK